jgi:hypothetical protein
MVLGIKINPETKYSSPDRTQWMGDQHITRKTPGNITQQHVQSRIRALDPYVRRTQDRVGVSFHAAAAIFSYV